MTDQDGGTTALQNCMVVVLGMVFRGSCRTESINVYGGGVFSKVSEPVVKVRPRTIRWACHGS